jgi:predicted LPLAT superfamily acyltransferase
MPSGSRTPASPCADFSGCAAQTTQPTLTARPLTCPLDQCFKKSAMYSNSLVLQFESLRLHHLLPRHQRTDALVGSDGGSSALLADN